MTENNENLITFPLEQNKKFPYLLDFRLQKIMKTYLSKNGRSYSTLARDIDRFVKVQYEDM